MIIVGESISIILLDIVEQNPLRSALNHVTEHYHSRFHTIYVLKTNYCEGVVYNCRAKPPLLGSRDEVSNALTRKPNDNKYNNKLDRDKNNLGRKYNKEPRAGGLCK